MLSILIKIFRSFSTKERIIVIGLTAITLLAAVLIALMAFHEKTVVVPKRGGVYTEGIVGQPSYINPVLARSGSPDADIEALIFASLTDIAENIRSDKNFQTWNVRLKEVFWQDGSPITSDDVIFTIQMIQNPETASPYFNQWQNITVNRISQREIQFELNSPYSLFKNLLTQIRPIPKKIFADLSFAHLNLSPYMLKPIGSGPFSFEKIEIRKDGFIESLTLKANESYQSIGKLPYIKKIVIRFYENKENLVQGYNSGQIDAFGTDYLDKNQINIHSNILVVPTSKYYALFLNPNANNLLTSQNIRQALDYLIDREKLNREIFGGDGLVAWGPLPSILPDYNPSLEKKKKEKSLEAVKKNLEEEGWIFDIENKIWNKKDSENEDEIKTFSFVLTTANIYPLNKIAYFLQKEWQNWGIEVKLNLVDPQNIPEAILKTRNYEALLFGNVVLKEPDLYAFWHSSQRFHPGLNLSLYHNPKVDNIIESLRKISPDEPQKKELISKLQEVIALEDIPAIFLVSPPYYYVSHNSNMGIIVKNIALPEDRFEKISQWYVKTKRKLSD